MDAGAFPIGAQSSSSVSV